MDNRYYTPTIKEFYVGFECEVDDLHDNLKDRIFRPIKVDWTCMDMICDDWEHKYKDFGSLYRVKYLNAADIEECGFVKKDYCIHFRDKHLVFADNYFLYKKEKGNLVYYAESLGNNSNNAPPFKYKVLISVWNKETMKLLNKDTPLVLFNGRIKNKSELKRLVKQLGIWE